MRDNESVKQQTEAAEVFVSWEQAPQNRTIAIESRVEFNTKR